MILDAGDLFLKSPYEIGEVENKQHIASLFVDAYNEMGYEAFNVGDNDLKLGLAKLQELEKQAKFPFISANIFTEKDTLNPVFKPYIILQKGNLKFGIIGLTSASPIEIKGLYVGDPIKYYQKYQDEVRNQCDYVILMAALDTNDEYNIVKRDLKFDMAILANQYRFSRYLMTQNGYITAFTDNSGKRIVKMQGVVDDVKKPFMNMSEISYRHQINEDRLERYRAATKGMKFEEYYKNQPTILKVVKRIEAQQEELQEDIKSLVNPLTYELIEVELDIPKDKNIEKKIEALRKYIGEEKK